MYSPDGFTIQFAGGAVWVLLELTPVPGTVWYVQVVSAVRLAGRLLDMVSFETRIRLRLVIGKTGCL
jgi:hypothetical protein